ncbi:Glu/Leu/Phe/Val dehydrogenase dimerization domain-containing protein [Reichenbachiella sp. MSK19-1]|uniref:Glu/Leu/Phe/Val dehydrogenase dimerization domain-containing protein n=1 Tax=Reichenbachiella sp. MSK19-1 TaxID=1897631 RepID=UPI000E6BCF0B|nr:Glu/Leu/Phe/Val dehydrogenase dimerization domain-containing protein [Reichenbachiella sp. MSK19-1]RJE72620.1 amino acid dehydrogenase [Reichenbachiella sp. MSK19-1]
MKELLRKFEQKRPEVVFEWYDDETGAEGWVVINSLRGGAAGGGTRMRLDLNRNEVESLAKTMEIKFTVSGPPIGGAKSGINFDPSDPRKKEVLARWYAAVTPLLKSYYGTGGDLNVDEIHEVIPITESNGLWHPQEGVFNGHFQPNEADKINRIGQLRLGVIKVIEDTTYSPDPKRKYTIADMITGFGVAESISHYYELWNDELVGKRVTIQGWGNVGAAAAFYLSAKGAKIIGIIDKSGGLIRENGFSHDEIVSLFVSKKKNTLTHPELLSYEEVDNRIWHLKTDIFVPAAASRLVDRYHVDRMIASGLELIASGANVPFADREIFYGPISEYVDHQVAVIPDFIANCGMARAFAYFMQGKADLSDLAIFEDTSRTIKNALIKIHQVNPSKTGLTQTAFENSLTQLSPQPLEITTP